MLLLSIVMTSLTGIGVVAVLAKGFYNWKPILIAAAIGAALAVPATWLVARQVA
ncbi:CTP synthetase [uncultured Paracoccus sp.]|uniref:CTP synthetase n=1 Tax=uncultured Paracoccus sp. TaxID=189685 RepID=UPI0025E7C0FC|nr:CTP synthetase [uncultured Paracoccus sp.]